MGLFLVHKVTKIKDRFMWFKVFPGGLTVSRRSEEVLGVAVLNGQTT